MKTTALLSFYANEGKKVSRKSWGEFKTQIFDIALPVCWRTTLKTSICQLKMLPTKSFVQFSTRGRTLQSMVNFDTTTSLPNNALAEYIVIGLPTHLRGKANEWELLEANPFDYPHFEKRLTLFNQIIKEQSSNQPSRTAPLSQPTNCSPDEVAWWVHTFLNSQGRCHFCKKTCGSLPGRCPNQMDKKWVDIPTSFVTPPKPADYKRPRAHDPPPSPAGRPTQPPAGRPPHWAATITAVDKHPATDVDSEETESFPPPSFKSDDTQLSVVSVREADSVNAVQLAKDNCLAPKFCTGNLAHLVDWHEMAAIKEDLYFPSIPSRLPILSPASPQPPYQPHPATVPPPPPDASPVQVSAPPPADSPLRPTKQPPIKPCPIAPPPQPSASPFPTHAYHITPLSFSTTRPTDSPLPPNFSSFSSSFSPSMGFSFCF
ncbi:hypothetical protein Pst134EA_028910 [Puccinia striiformis f. sp. tritici]|uniref:hypothetical protein n=1 Tax=Puccinia striiformis f. sp. tritici TaxID=168172 RepID=UPI002008138A|nr:hypothetical protein Pst134EA_028910 [Puccinia striiformis f. sp. tritici]KAH9446924.1 hypothetical protein Pst134EA_028910 [Puccinia striiformis f. sp. tritici]